MKRVPFLTVLAQRFQQLDRINCVNLNLELWDTSGLINTRFGKAHLSLFQGFLVQLMDILLLAPVGNVESLDCDVEVVLHVARVRNNSLQKKKGS